MELGQMYADKPKDPPVAPALVFDPTFKPTRGSDSEAIEALQMDRRWQLVLDALM